MPLVITGNSNRRCLPIASAKCKINMENIRRSQRLESLEPFFLCKFGELPIQAVDKSVGKGKRTIGRFLNKLAGQSNRHITAVIQHVNKRLDASVISDIIYKPARKFSMNALAGFQISVFRCLEFLDMKHHLSRYQLLFNHPACRLKLCRIQVFFPGRNLNNRLCRLMPLSAVSLMSRLSAWLSARFFACICNLCMIGIGGGRKG